MLVALPPTEIGMPIGLTRKRMSPTSITTHFQLNVDLEPEHAEGRYGWDRLRLIELFAIWRLSLTESLALKACSPGAGSRSTTGRPAGAIDCRWPRFPLWSRATTDTPTNHMSK